MSREIDIEKATKYLIDYWRTYPEQRNYLNYMDKTFIHDALYGLGKAIDAHTIYYKKHLHLKVTLLCSN